MKDMQVRPLGCEDPLEKGTATNSSLLAWRIPWAEEPGGLQSMGSLRVGHYTVRDGTHTSCIRKQNPTSWKVPEWAQWAIQNIDLWGEGGI